MKKFLFTVAVLLCGMNSFAQERMVDAVYLKDGSIIRGMIIEQVPNKQIKLQTADGSVFVYMYDEIEKMTKEQTMANSGKKKISSALSSNEKYDLTGTRGFVDLGYVAGGFKGPELYVSYGYQFNRYWFLGGGTGIHYMTDYSTVSIPFYVDARGYALDGPISPYIAFRIGYKLNTKSVPRRAKKGGFYCNPMVGVRFMTNSTNAVNLAVGYTVQTLSFDNDEEGWGNMKGFTVKIGYEF